MNEQNNENGNIEQDVFAEVLKTACAALYGDTATRRLAAGDIIHALASAYPGVGAAKDAHGVHVKDYTFVKAQTPCTKVIEATLATGRKVSACIVGETLVERAHSLIYDNDNQVCRIEFFGKYQGSTWVDTIAKRAFHGLLHCAYRRHRKTVNKKLRAAAARADGCPF